MSSLPVSPTIHWPVDAVEDELACKVAGEFFATWMTTPAQIEARTYRGPGLEVTSLYLRALFRVREDQYTDGQLLMWFADEQARAQQDGDPEVYKKFMSDYVQPAVTNCAGSVCKSLGWEGNADLAGIGVYTSYLIEAALTTIFLIVLLARHYGRWGGSRPRSSGFSQRLLDAFDGALPDLEVGVFVFSFAVMCASLLSITTALDDPASVTTYDVVTGTLVAVFSVCPATQLYCLDMMDHHHHRDSGDRPGPKRSKTFTYILHAAFLALWALMLAVVNLARTTNPSTDALHAGSIGEPFEVYCPVIGDGPLEAVRIFAVASAGLGVLLVLYLVFRRGNGKRARDNKSEDSDTHTRAHWPAVVSVLAWVVMWFFLGLFTALRARIIEVAGESDQSNEWGFGQIIALGTWVPVVLTFFHVLFFDTKED